MLKLEYFYYIKEIEITGSINKAAQNLYISQPYLSLCLKRTEEEIGFQIFHRTNKGVFPTKLGKAFLSYCEEIIEIIKKTNNLKNLSDQKDNKLTIASMPSYTMLDIYESFRKICKSEYEKCEISYLEMPTTYIAQKVKSGEADIGLIYFSSESSSEYLSEFENLNLNFSTLATESVQIVVGHKNKLSNKDFVYLDDLKDQEFLAEKVALYKNKPPIFNNPFPKIFSPSQSGDMIFNNNRSMFHFLSKTENSFCISQKNLNLTNPSVLSGHLKYLPVLDLDSSFFIGFLTNDEIESSDLQEFFIDYIEDYFK